MGKKRTLKLGHSVRVVNPINESLGVGWDRYLLIEKLFD